MLQVRRGSQGGVNSAVKCGNTGLVLMWAANWIQSVMANEGDCAEQTTSQFFIFSFLIQEYKCKCALGGLNIALKLVQIFL